MDDEVVDGLEFLELEFSCCDCCTEPTGLVKIEFGFGDGFELVFADVTGLTFVLDGTVFVLTTIGGVGVDVIVVGVDGTGE